MKIYHLLILIFIAVVAGYAFFRGSEAETQVKTASARISNIEQSILVPGIIQPGREIAIKPSISGIVESVYVSVGDEVKEGDPLMRIKIAGDPIEYAKLLRQFEATSAQYEHQKRFYEMNKSLFEQHVIAWAEMDQIETNCKTSEAAYEAARIQLQMLNGKIEGGLSYNIIRSTSGGTVLELPVKPGGSVIARSVYNEGTTAARLADLSSLTFYGNVPEKDVSLLKTEDTISLALAALPGKEVPAILRLISPKGTQVNGTTVFELYADLLPVRNINTYIRAGYSANAKIIVGRVQSALSLEEKYLQFENDTPYVEIKIPGKMTKKQQVLLGLSDGINTQILSGITTGDKIILPNIQEEPK